MKRFLLSMTCLGFSAFTFPALAQTATGNMVVSTTVTSICAIVATNMVFAGYSQTVPTDSTAIATAQCTGTSGTLNFTVGNGGNFAAASRQMINGVNFINYQVAQTVGGADLLNTTNVPIVVAPTTGAGSTTLFGRIPAAQGNKPAGIYLDTVVLTLTW